MLKPIILLSLFASNFVFADCEFSVINYTNSIVTAKVGFYNGIESSLKIPPATTKVLKLKNDYLCNSANSLGMGVSYIMFPNDPNGAGANYSPESNKVNLLGKATGERNGRPMIADDGAPIWLNYSGNAIDADSFQVKLSFIARPNSKSAGTQ